jgi:hypothetical protein
VHVTAGMPGVQLPIAIFIEAIFENSAVLFIAIGAILDQKNIFAPRVGVSVQTAICIDSHVDVVAATVRVVLPEILPEVAVIVAVPAAIPVNWPEYVVPPHKISATDVSEELQLTW